MAKEIGSVDLEVTSVSLAKGEGPGESDKKVLRVTMQMTAPRPKPKGKGEAPATWPSDYIVTQEVSLTLRDPDDAMAHGFEVGDIVAVSFAVVGDAAPEEDEG